MGGREAKGGTGKELCAEVWLTAHRSYAWEEEKRKSEKGEGPRREFGQNLKRARVRAGKSMVFFVSYLGDMDMTCRLGAIR